MLPLLDILKSAVESGAADVFLIAGAPVTLRCGGEMRRMEEESLHPAGSEGLLREIYHLARREIDPFLQKGDDDFSLSVPELSRFRVSAYRQRGSMAAVIRVVPFGIPDYQALHIPESVMALAEKQSGLVIVTGPAGGGKSTTLACILHRINATRSGHIITLEEPIEYLHRNEKSIVSQREIALDSENYVTALRACLRQSPNVIMLGEMRDFETIRTAMTAAETGHLVFSSLHTLGAANTIDRIIDVFPPDQQQQIRVQLSMLLQSVVSQQLAPAVDGTLQPVFEVMHVNNAVKNMIRESKTHQLDATIAVSSAEGMRSMDADLLQLAIAGRITRETAVRCAVNADSMRKKLNF